MKRIILGVVLIISLCVFYPGDLYAQEAEIPTGTAYEIAFNDYTLSLEAYNKAHEKYVLARAQYLRFDTLTARNEAKEATQNMLSARDDVIIKYLNSVVERLQETEGINQEARVRVITELENEISWFEDHKAGLVGAGSLDDLKSDSDEAAKRYNVLGQLAYEAVSFVPLGRVTKFQERLNENFLAVKDRVASIRSEERKEYQLTKRDLESIDNWIFETEQRIARGNVKYNKAQPIINTIRNKKSSNNSSLGKYNQVVAQLDLSKLDYKDASLSIREIIKVIKTD
ncbi:hypothetical protein IPM62_02515 [Candidatus Woesebacteria bacterium]|nr:MAG: hypothetical protein IPM62_02515 [Candidatus Woesebacteria bacterium]